jgi:hypothetical protein
MNLSQQLYLSSLKARGIQMGILPQLRQRTRLRRVAPTLLAGSAPTEALLKKLKSQGVQQVIDLQLPHERQESEAAWCAQLGINYICIPMKDSLPDFSIMEELLNDCQQATTYLHCHEGRNRTGAVVSLYRIVVQGWSVTRAECERQLHGFDIEVHTLGQDVRFYAVELRRMKWEREMRGAEDLSCV